MSSTGIPELDRIYALWDAGVRARDWPEEDIKATKQATKDHWLDAYTRLIAYYSALDRGNYRGAQVEIALALKEASLYDWEDEAFLPLLQYEQTFIQALLREDLESYDPEMIECDFEDEIPREAQNRAYAATLWALGHKEEATARIEIAKAAIHKENPEIKPNMQAELDWLDLIPVG